MIVVIVAVLAALGLIFACVILALLGGRYVNKYRELVQRYEDARHKRVKDLSGSPSPQSTFQMCDLN